MKTLKPHIIFLTPGFAESEKDSATIPALQVYLKALQKAKPEIKMTLIAFQFPFSNENYIWNDINIIPINGRNRRVKKLWVWKKAFLTLNKLHKENPIIAIHSFWIGECSLIGSRFSKQHNIKHIVTAMGQDANLGNRHIKSIESHNTQVVTLSKNQHSSLLENYNINSEIIPWFLDDVSFSELKASTIDILAVGSLNKVKNYELFISIIASLIKTHSHIKVEIIGEGIEQKKTENKIALLGLTKAITLVGKLDRKKVIEKMMQSDILLHTSNYESFGFVFLEALSTGMKIVSKNVGIADENNEKWAVCNTEIEMIESCTKFLDSTTKKERVILNSKEFTISAYLKLYNE
ncbi:glycosyltransferase [Winogradskyella sp.]|uniref:glycosyltransferase n=1 Tax=Winogradskyella sp. TaxID=1883156 RepID=UPI0025D29E73|nr:glycosyltransferase [Winogradskyella sp.]